MKSLQLRHFSCMLSVFLMYDHIPADILIPGTNLESMIFIAVCHSNIVHERQGNIKVVHADVPG
jgi:hypothetical protein